jgi:hypothetical protein
MRAVVRALQEGIRGGSRRGSRRAYHGLRGSRRRAGFAAGRDGRIAVGGGLVAAVAERSRRARLAVGGGRGVRVAAGGWRRAGVAARSGGGCLAGAVYITILIVSTDD